MNREKQKLYDKLLDMVYVENKELTSRQERVLKLLAKEKGKEQLKQGLPF